MDFPQSFIFGTSTSAGQIETAFEHNWEGILAKDGAVFRETTGHERRMQEDARLILSLAPHYRMSLMWSRLQRYPYAPLDQDEVRRYLEFMEYLRAAGVKIMLVIDHWVHPRWFANPGGWSNRHGIRMWLDYVGKIVSTFGSTVSSWNTFNEPNLFVTFSRLIGEFPPFQKNIFTAVRTIKHMDAAHEEAYALIKSVFPQSMVGVSYNTLAVSAVNWKGRIPAAISRWWYMDYLASFFKTSDFTGISYYARLSFDPYPLTALECSEKLDKAGIPHDDIWEYYPEGLRNIVRDFWQSRGKPIIITENGICTSDDTKRISAIYDYARILRQLIREGVDVRGYYHWSSWDNFEWTLGPSYHFGLCSTDPVTGVRHKKPSADVYSKLAWTHTLDETDQNLNA